MDIPIKPDFRASADQVVRLAGHGVCTIRFLGICPVSGTRLYDVPGASYLAHLARTLVAADYGMSGPDVLVSWLMCNESADNLYLAVAHAKQQWQPLPALPCPTN